MAMAYAVIQAVVTVALLGFAYLVRRESPDTSSLVVGAGVAFWLRESVHMGQQAARRREERENGAEGG
ncbi:MAG: hypothetical protein M3P34_00260 [Actinomycetota bacterium]|nr:hypothetical protein [Actinomycetota bacterium]